MDKINSEQRSKNMAAIHSKNTKPEVFFRKLLFNKGYRYSISNKKLPGKPDMNLRKYNTAIYIHGCFWHRHGCSLASEHKNNVEFWNKKFEAEVKTTKHVESSTMYITANELAKSELESERYYLYRVYNFDMETMSGDISVRKGSLKQLCISAQTYKVNFE